MSDVLASLKEMELYPDPVLRERIKEAAARIEELEEEVSRLNACLSLNSVGADTNSAMFAGMEAAIKAGEAAEARVKELEAELQIYKRATLTTTTADPCLEEVTEPIFKSGKQITLFATRVKKDQQS